MTRERRRCWCLGAALGLGLGLWASGGPARAEDGPTAASEPDAPAGDGDGDGGGDASGDGGGGPTGSEGGPGAAPPAEEPDALSRYRTPFPVLTERVIGTASRLIEFDWRRTKVHLGGAGAQPFELNNFNSARAGALARFPSNNLLYEVGVGWVWVWDSPSSELLALTPYRQAGRPRRIALDFNVGIPLAEGAVTTAPRWFPVVELVFSAYAGLRYAWYPGGTQGLRVRDRVAAVVNPTVSRAERDNLDPARLDAMQVDPARYTTMVGFGNDIYFRQGVFVNPRASLAVPVLGPISGSDLTWWGEFSLSIGLAL